MKKLSKQQGFALFLLAVLLATAAATVTVKAIKHRSGNIQISRDRITADALAQAKEALIGYAITYGDKHPGSVHGYLPCPDIDGTNFNKPAQGVPDPTCGNQDVSQIGRIPWRTLDLGPQGGGDGECLWYAVSGTYKNSPPTGLMNWDTNGQLQVYASDGTTLLTPADNQAVAVIFAPGNALTGQSRTPTDTLKCGGNYTASNYLENDTVHHINNADIATGKFIQPHEDRDANGNIILTVNDRMVFITKQDIWNAMRKRDSDLLIKLGNMTLQVANCIADYGNKNAASGNHSLPWPARITLSDYGNTASYNDKEDLYAGRVPYQVDTSKAKTHNSIASNYLLTSSGLNCPSGWADIYPWWYNWKEHLFYAIGQEFKPSDHATNSCGTCLTLNKNTPGNETAKYAAVVIFAGKKLPSPNQTRVNKSVVADYLEGRNAANMAGSADGNEDYQVDASTTFNDIVYCIKDGSPMTVVTGNPLTTPVCPP